jgi:hypothetical protein
MVPVPGIECHRVVRRRRRKSPLFFGVAAKDAIGTSRHFAAPQKLVAIGCIADIAAQLYVYEFAPCCRSVQHDVVKYHFLIAYLA